MSNVFGWILNINIILKMVSSEGQDGGYLWGGSEDWLEMGMNELLKKDDSPIVIAICKKSLNCTLKIYTFYHM